MQLLLISSNDQIHSIASAIHNVCNATLSLLFTAALFIWGFLVNRKQAWRIEGGTAVFGGAALGLALVSTALNFLYVPREGEYLWLPGLMWAVVLWQSFLGWWWWVGSGGWTLGSNNVPVEEMISRMEKRERQKRERHEKRRETREKARLALRGVAGAFVKNRRPLRTEGDQTPPSPTAPPSIQRSEPPSRSRSPSPTPSTDIDSGPRPRLVPNFVYQWYQVFRHAHQVAAREQTVEQQERIREIESFSWWGPLRRWRLQNVSSYGVDT